MDHTSYTFPGSTHASEIPMWMNFAAIPYDLIRAFQDRADTPYTIAGEATAKIAVPFQGEFVNSSALSYTNDANMIAAQISGGAQYTNSEAIRLQGISQLITKDDSGNSILDAMPVSDTGVHNVYLSVDMMDMMFLGGGHKEYKINLNLVCQNALDSLIAGKICSVFSSECWPLLDPGRRKLLHPHVWAFWISATPHGSPLVYDIIKNEPIKNPWIDGDGPMLSVLTGVDTRRVGGENNRILAIKNGTEIVPMQYVVSLSFVELEPTVQHEATERHSTYNRSTALFGSDATASGTSSSA